MVSDLCGPFSEGLFLLTAENGMPVNLQEYNDGTQKFYKILL
jgi:hypothetical protein